MAELIDDKLIGELLLDGDGPNSELVGELLLDDACAGLDLIGALLLDDAGRGLTNSLRRADRREQLDDDLLLDSACCELANSLRPPADDHSLDWLLDWL